MESLTPASAEDLPPIGNLIADVPFWRYQAGLAREGVAHLRVWLTAVSGPVNKNASRVALLPRKVSVMRCDVQALVGISMKQHL